MKDKMTLCLNFQRAQRENWGVSGLSWMNFRLLEMTVVWLLKKVRQRERVVRHSSTPDEQSVPWGFEVTGWASVWLSSSSSSSVSFRLIFFLLFPFTSISLFLTFNSLLLLSFSCFSPSYPHFLSSSTLLCSVSLGFYIKLYHLGKEIF